MTTPDPIGAAAHQLMSQIDELVNDILTTCQREIPAYSSRRDAQFEQELLDAFRGQALAMLELQTTGRVFDKQNLIAIKELARRRSQQGFSQGDVVRAYNIGVRLGLTRLVAELHTVGNLRALELKELSGKVIDDVMGSAGLINDAIAEAFREIESVVLPFPKKQQASALRDLLQGELSDSVVTARLVLLNLSPSQYYACAVVDWANQATLEARASELCERLTDVLDFDRQAIFVGTIDSELVVVIAQEDGQRLDGLTRSLSELEREVAAEGCSLFAGVGRAEPGVQGLGLSYREASEALQVVRTSAGVPRVLTYEQALPYALLRDGARIAAEIVRVSVAPLLAHDREAPGTPLLPVLRAHLETVGNDRAAARLLPMHPRTFRRRLELIQAVTGSSLDGSRGMLLFGLGLLAIDKHT